MADQEGGHGAQEDGRARHVGLLSVAFGLLGLTALEPVGDRLVLLELPVDDDVEGEEREEGQE